MSLAANLKRILLGSGSVRSDDPHTITPDVDLIEAVNVTVGGGLIEKEGGSRRWNTTALLAPIIGFFDWRPTDIDSFTIVVTSDGKVWRYYNRNVVIEITPYRDAPETLTIEDKRVHIVEGGSELGDSKKKLFILTGNDPVQVISGLSTVRKDIAKPAADWAGTNHPFYALMVQGRMVMFGNKNRPHCLYCSMPTDHEDFEGAEATFTTVYPGIGSRLISAFSYRGRLFCLKDPGGVISVHEMVLLNPWAELAGVPAQIVHSTELGARSHNCWAPFAGDILVSNSAGTVTSLATAANFQDVRMGDILLRLRNQRYMQNEIDKDALDFGQAFYYPAKNRSYFAFRGAGALNNNRVMVLDGSTEGVPKITWTTKDQPNCFGLIKTGRNIQKPFYGADDGYLYQMDVEDRDVAGVGYRARFMTPYLNIVDPKNPEDDDVTKNFKALELGYEGTGDWDLTVDSYIDGRKEQTLTFNLKGRATLGIMRLDETLLDESLPMSQVEELVGSGKRISFDCWNEGVGENFRVLYLKVFYSPGAKRATEGG